VKVPGTFTFLTGGYIITVIYKPLGGETMTIADRKEREKRQRCDSILGAAKELFYEKGYQLTTMERIAERAELNKATIYLYFSSKDELYLAITLEGILELETRLTQALAKAKDPEGRIRTIFNIFTAHCLENPELFRISQYFLAGTARENLAPRLLEEINVITSRLLGLGRDALAEGMDRGDFRRGLDPELFCLIAWRMATGLLDLFIPGGAAGKRGEADSRLFEEALDILIEGIRVK
jgi:TetR/AcrR family transcriptional regulator